jgi:O-antigen/teichoic acid export membrane protein
VNAIHKILTHLHRSSFAKDTATLTLGTFLAQLLGMATMPFMSRLYSPADFGQLAVFAAVVVTTATAITLRYETAILLPKNERQSTDLILLSLTLTSCLGIILSIFALGAPDEIKTWLGIGSLGDWFPFAVLSGIGSSVIAVGANWLNRRRAYIQMSTQRLIQSIIAVGLGIGFGLGGNVAGLLIAQVVAVLVTCMIVIAQVWPLLRHWSPQAIAAIAREHIAAPKFLLPTALLDVVTMQLPVLLITAWFSSDSAGQFSMAWRILALPMSLIGGAVGLVFFQRFSKVWPDVPAARRLLLKTWKILALVGLLPTVVVMVFGELFFSFVLGEAWREAGVMAAVMAPMLLAMLVSSPTSTSYLVIGLQKYSLIFGLASLIYRPMSLYVGFLNKNIYLAIFLYSFFEIFQIFLYQFVVFRKLRVVGRVT